MPHGSVVIEQVTCFLRGNELDDRLSLALNSCVCGKQSDVQR